MEKISTDFGHVEGDVVGQGPPVLLIHGSIVADGYEPLRTQESLTDNFQVVFYHRRGFGGSADHDGPFSIAQQAAEAVTVLDHFGIDRAHLVGHSYGAVTALQVVLDVPDRAQSLVLEEPPLFCVPSAAAFGEAMEQIGALYGSGDKAGALEAFLVGVGGPDYRERIDPHLPPGWYEQALTEVDLFFQVEAPALAEWSFGPDQARTIKAPTLAVVGEQSTPFFKEGIDFLDEHLGAERFVVADATHSLQMSHPKVVADAIADFLLRQ